MQHIKTKTAAGGAALFASAALAAALLPGAAVAHDDPAGDREAHARLNALNNSGASGSAEVHSAGRRLHIEVNARGVVKGLPHAMHIHYGAEARHECPTAAMDDANNDFRLTTSEGVPAYGEVRVSLTTTGKTDPGSALAVDRFPTAPRGQINYNRTTKTQRDVVRAIRHGEAVVVVHGVDYNGNGMYDFRSAGRSDLDPKLPAEATDPAICGVLRVG